VAEEVAEEVAVAEEVESGVRSWGKGVAVAMVEAERMLSDERSPGAKVEVEVTGSKEVESEGSFSEGADEDEERTVVGTM
jgi:hypothetical protein